MATELISAHDCEWDGQCWQRCEDCPFSNIVWEWEDMVLAILDKYDNTIINPSDYPGL